MILHIFTNFNNFILSFASLIDRIVSILFGHLFPLKNKLLKNYKYKNKLPQIITLRALSYHFLSKACFNKVKRILHLFKVLLLKHRKIHFLI